MRDESLPSGLKGHSDGVKRLQAMFAQEGGKMSQNRFDALVFAEVDAIHTGRSECPMIGMSGDDYILHSFNGEGMWGYFLSILQHMVDSKLASQTGKLPNVIYSCPACAER